jgi:hypothetical protein
LGYNDLGPQLLTEVSLNYGDIWEENSWLSGLGDWTPDGRMLAYSDTEGLWLWDVFTVGAQRRLLLPTDDAGIPYPRHFSPRGRYLACTQGETLATLDLMEGTAYPDGIISPDERTMLVYHASEENSLLEVCWLAPYQCPIETGGIDSFEHVRDAAWKNSREYIIVNCNSGETDMCWIVQNAITSHYSFYSSERGYAFAYDPETRSLAIVGDVRIVSINGEQFDLSQWLDGDIVSIEWLPSLFYREER